MKKTYFLNLVKTSTITTCCLITLSCTVHKYTRPTSIPEDMVFVPAGEFIMGNNNDYYDNDSDERPQHIVNLPAFYIDKYPVTNSQYKKFVEATGHQPPRFWDKSGNYPPNKSDHPVVGVSFLDAQAYARWVGKRLPTEEEWEKAARGTDARRWPWGNKFDHTKANVRSKGTTPVGSFPESASPYGAYDMAGNVWELVDSWYELYPNSPENETVARLLGKKYKVVRGGDYNSGISSARCADRGVKKINDAGGPSLGFRCVLDVSGYEYYRGAQELLNQAKNLKTQAEKDITAYEEHLSSRLLLKEVEILLEQALDRFKNHNFEESKKLAKQAQEQIRKAHQLALDYTKNKHAEKIAQIKEVLTILDALLKKIPAKLSPHDLELKDKALDHFKQSEQFFEESSWGYAQMHAYIGLSIVRQIIVP